MGARRTSTSSTYDSTALMQSVEGRIDEDLPVRFESAEVAVVTYGRMIAPHCQHRVFCHGTRLTREHGGQKLLLVRKGCSFGSLVHAVRQWDWSLVLVGIAWVEIERSGSGRGRFRVLPWPALTDDALRVSRQVRRALVQLADFTPCRDLRDNILAILRSKDLRVLSDRVPGALTTEAGPLAEVAREPVLAERLRLGLRWLERTLAGARAYENSTRDRLPATATHRMRELTLWRRFLPGATRGAILYDAEQQPAETAELLLMCTENPSAVWALRKSDGITVWKRCIRGVIGVPKLANRIAVVKLERGLAALEVDSGAVLWMFKPKLLKRDPHIGSPVITKDACFVVGGNRAYRLSLESGAVLWDVPYEGEVLASVSDLVLASGASGFAAFKQSTGEMIWNVPGLWSYVCLMTAKGVAVFCSGWGLTWVEPVSGEVLAVWKIGDGERIHSFCVAEELALAMLARDDNPQDFTVIALKSGEVVHSGPGHERAKLYFEPNTGLVYEWTYEGIAVLDPVTGQRLADIVGGHHLYCAPAIRDGLIHCFTLDAQVWAMRHPRIADVALW